MSIEFYSVVAVTGFFMSISGGDIIDWYVLRTLTGKEEAVLSIMQKLGMCSEFEVFCPKRKIGWRKNGFIVSITRPLFEGYLFVANSKKNIRDFESLLRRYKLNSAWLVRSAGAVVPISDEERTLLLKLMNCRKVVEVSQVEIIEDQFKVIDGPLVGLEHMIKRYSKKNRRITVEMPILQEVRKIELEGILVNSEHNMK